MSVTTIGPDHPTVTTDSRRTVEPGPIVAWAPSDPTAEPGRRGTRRLGAGLGVVIALVPAIAGGIPTSSLFFALGIPAAGIVGGLLGPSVRERSGLGGTALSMAVLTIVVADLLLLGGALIQVVISPTSLGTTSVATAIFGLAYIGMIGLVIVGVPMLVVTIPCAFIWTFVLRRLVQRGDGRQAA